MISFLVHFLRQHFFIILCCVITAILWPNLRKHFIPELDGDYDESASVRQQFEDDSIRLLTVEELTQFDGIHNKQLFLSILGTVYDVSKGAKHYGPGGSYNYFVGKKTERILLLIPSYNSFNVVASLLGKDASVAFITGDFEKDPNAEQKYDDDDVLKRLKPQEIYSIFQWQKFYDKDYTFVGRLAGRYYGYDGQKTEYMQRVEQQIELAINEKEQQKMLRIKYPPCNIEWLGAETGTRVWCSKQSGGIDRDFVGVPRKFYEVGKTEYRCACVPNDRLDDPLLQQYDNCDSKSTECFYTV